MTPIRSGLAGAGSALAARAARDNQPNRPVANSKDFEAGSANRTAQKSATPRRVGRPPSEHNPVDTMIAERLRIRRHICGMTQSVLADAVSLSFQQIQKFEKGLNRVSASQLFRLSQALGVTVDYFFEDGVTALDAGPGLAEPQARFRPPEPGGDAPMRRVETLTLVEAYYGIPDAPSRRKFAELVKAVSER